MADLAAITEQATQGDPEAQCALARVWHVGADGAATSLPKAMQWYFKAASQGHVEAQLRLGLLLLDDVTKAGGKRNPKQAFDWLTKAAQAGNAAAQCRLGLMLLAGDGTDKDAEAGMKWLHGAALENNAGAQFALGYRYCTGQDVEKDTARGLQCLLMATQQDHGDAMLHLAMMLEHGVGFDQPNAALAARMYFRAVAKHNNYAAAHNLAVMHATGRGVEHDPLLAQELLEFAISAGEYKAMYDLGLLLTHNGPQQDFPAAAMWATLAAKHHPEGKGSRLLEVLGKLATPEQIADGQRRAASWQRQPKGITLMTVGDGANPFTGLSISAEATADPREGRHA